MALFGLLKDSKDPDGMTGNEKLGLIFAGLSDFGSMRAGGEANAIDMFVKGTQARRQKAARDGVYGDANRLMTGYSLAQLPQVNDRPIATADAGLSPNAGDVGDVSAGRGAAPLPNQFNLPSLPQINALPQKPQVPLRSGPADVSDPRWAALAMKADRYGVKLENLMDVMRLQQPDVKIGPDGRPYNSKAASALGMQFRNPANVNNTIVDLNNPENENRYVPDAPVKGSNAVYDNRGRVVDWTLPGGAARAIAGAKEAETIGATRGSLREVPQSDGSTRLMLGSDYLGQGGPLGAGLPGQGGPGGLPQRGPQLGVRQSPSDAAYDTHMANDSATRFKSLQDAGNSAPQKIARLNQISGLLGDFEGGKLAPMGLELASALNSIGWKMDKKTSNAQAADAIGNQLVLEMNGGSLGTGFSNADREFLTKTVPGILQSSGGRRQMIDIAGKTYQRQADVAGMARKWTQRFGRLDRADSTGRTFDDYLADWSGKHTLFGGR